MPHLCYLQSTNRDFISTTTLRIEPSLRERITQLAQALDQTPHNFMLQALAEKADDLDEGRPVDGLGRLLVVMNSSARDK